jgi:hypothetical protein
LAARLLPAQCMEITAPDTLSYTVQVAEVSLEQPVDRKFWYHANNPNIQDELLTVYMRVVSGPAVGDWRYQWCEDPATHPNAQCRPIQPWETEFTTVDTVYSEADWYYDAEIYATTYGTAEVEVLLTREFCPGEPIQRFLSMTVESLDALTPRPEDWQPLPAWPNPFNPIAHIPFRLDAPGAVRVEVYDLAGRLVSVPLAGSLPAGYHEALFDGAGLPSGRYQARIVQEDRITSLPLTLIK